MAKNAIFLSHFTQLACSGIPASSAPVEKLFSVPKKVFKDERCRLKDETLK